MSTAEEEIDYLEGIRLRLDSFANNELEPTVSEMLPQIIWKINSPNDPVRTKAVEVLTLIEQLYTENLQLQIPVGDLLDQYKEYDGQSSFLKDFAIIFITLGYSRLELEQRTVLATKLLACEDNSESYRDKFLMLLLPILHEIQIPDDAVERKDVLKLNEKPVIRKHFLQLLQDVLLLPYAASNDQQLPPGMSMYNFKRVMPNNWQAEELERIKKSILHIICAGIFTNNEIFTLLVLASSDAIPSVAKFASEELTIINQTLDFTDPLLTAPLYALFLGNSAPIPDRKTTPCSANVREQLLKYLIRCRGQGFFTLKGIRIITEGLLGINTNEACKVLVFKFTEHLIRNGSILIVAKVANIILAGILKILEESNEVINVKNAAFSALLQLARTCPCIDDEDITKLCTKYNDLTNASPVLKTSINEQQISEVVGEKTEQLKSVEDQPIELKENQVPLVSLDAVVKQTSLEPSEQTVMSAHDDEPFCKKKRVEQTTDKDPPPIDTLIENNNSLVISSDDDKCLNTKESLTATTNGETAANTPRLNKKIRTRNRHAIFPLTITIKKTDADGPMTSAELNYCEDYLWQMMCLPNLKINAESYSLHNGTIVIKCCTIFTYKWICETVSRMPPFGNVRFTAESVNEDEQSKRAVCWIPGKFRELSEVLAHFDAQNYGIFAKKWVVFSYQKYKKGNEDGAKLIVDLNLNTSALIKDRLSQRPYLHLGRVKFDFYPSKHR